MSDFLDWIKVAAPSARCARITADDKAELQRLAESGASPEALHAFLLGIIERVEREAQR